ncbi:transposase [uncultured Paracoccus sp.]|uniref:transposase n=1 Tax=uncultured Paracoccus sp. TaxID=189685 RepID=UPI0025F8FC5B|nr:transposase [uncultured Paracoccus sp.]
MEADTSFGHWKTQTFVAALRHDGLAALWLIDGAMTREMFDTYVETQLAPAPGAGDMVILDNLAAHKSEKAKAALRRLDALFRFPPPAAPT